MHQGAMENSVSEQEQTIDVDKKAHSSEQLSCVLFHF